MSTVYNVAMMTGTLTSPCLGGPNDEEDHHFNYMPRGAEPIEESAFWDLINCWGIKQYDHRQCYYDPQTHEWLAYGADCSRAMMATVKLFVVHGAVIAHSTKHGLRGVAKCHESEYWRVGCKHPRMGTAWSEMHTRVDTCPDCGFKAQYDTSG